MPLGGPQVPQEVATFGEGDWITTLDHVGIAVADYPRSKAFYEQALAPLGLNP